MLYLREANIEDIEKEYEYIRDLPLDENGFVNRFHGLSFEEFRDVVLPRYINHAKGIDLPENRSPQIELFLWDDDKIVGLFRLRYNLTKSLIEGAGHIGYGIKKEYRGRGYATKGLEMTIKKAWKIISEDEIYMSVNKYNIASLRTQIKNGAYIHHENEEQYFTRIKNNL
ncbi:MAG: GNAT family N-acetyltransferase [Tissierellia bacterium]|nr:GNAT family N-acetyltransferase [Tissierellia bacterium]